MNALQDNAWTQSLARQGRTLIRNAGRPECVVMVSAHWETAGIQLQASVRPKQIFDFYGFPKPLYEVHYTPPGQPTMAQRLSQLLPGSTTTESWGLDHGGWSVLKHIFPNADVPVVSVSLDRHRNAIEHVQIGKSLASLRDEGCLLVMSGNIVHNLRALQANGQNNGLATAAPWALRFQAQAANASTDLKTPPERLVQELLSSPDFLASHPSLEHFLPWAVWMGTRRPSDGIEPSMMGIEHHSISMAGWVAR